MIKKLVDRDYSFEVRDEVRGFFTKVIRLYKNWNYGPPDSADYQRYKNELKQAAAST